MIYKTLHRKLKIEQHNPNKNTRGRNSCSISGIRHATLVTNPVISHEWGKDRIVSSPTEKTHKESGIPWAVCIYWQYIYLWK